MGARAAATSVAESRLDLMCVRTARVQFLERLKSHPDGLLPPRKLPLRLAMRILAKKYGPPSQAAKADDAMAEGARILWGDRLPEERDAVALAQCLEQLVRMDRYERRATSRRKTAIRAFDRIARLSRAKAEGQL